MAVKKTCYRKRRFKTSQEAWEHAAFKYIQDLGVRNIYKCQCGKFHLTHMGNLGDMSHIPEMFHPLFITATEEYEKGQKRV